MDATEEAARRVGRWLMSGRRRRKLYDALNHQLPRVLGDRVRSGPAAGLRFVGGDTVGYLLGASEPAVQNALVTYLEPGSVLFDVGAHAGFLTILGCRLVGPTGCVHAFEPIAANVNVLRSNLARNGFSNATVHQVALTDQTGEVHMTAGTHHITAAITGSGETVVEAVRCDELELPPPTLVKIDVEGAERKVLDGMSGILAEHRPVLVVEVHGDQRMAVERFLNDAGYAHRVLNDDGMLHLLATPPQ
jgi:FkbM family methyltransferase